MQVYEDVGFLHPFLFSEIKWMSTCWEIKLRAFLAGKVIFGLQNCLIGKRGT